MQSEAPFPILHRRSMVLSLSLLLAAGACGNRKSSLNSSLRIFAAASLTDVLTDIGDKWTAQGELAPKFVFAGTSTLARQIEQGAPADLFFSANAEWMDYLEARNLIDPITRRAFASNRLVIVAPVDRTPGFLMAPGSSLAEVLGKERLAIAEEAVPAGKYAREALQSMQMWDDVKNQLVLAPDVRAVLSLVEFGEAGAGIVYQTDALAVGAAGTGVPGQTDTRIAVLGEFPATSHAPVIYEVAAVSRGRGESFLNFLNEAAARDSFDQRGFHAPLE